MFNHCGILLATCAILLAVSRVHAADAVPATGGAAALTPQNTKIQFVCAHVGPKPDPRKGGFGKFTGQALLDGKSLKSLSLDIDTTSLFTEFDMLTTHLKSADFFEVRRFPTAKFQSTKIEPTSDGCQITGKLTLHGVTKELTIPAKTNISNAGLALSSEFTINRHDFGISFGPEKVEQKVSLTVVIGDKL
jgi:polyisoprenoid-binding protein YceI